MKGACQFFRAPLCNYNSTICNIVTVPDTSEQSLELTVSVKAEKEEDFEEEDFEEEEVLPANWHESNFQSRQTDTRQTDRQKMSAD